MRISTLAYSIRQGVMNIRRNKLFSIASIGTIAACVFLLGIFYAIVTNFNHIVNQAEDQVAVTVFFDSGITEEQITEIGDQIKENDAVGEIVYTSAEEAWETFSKEYFKGHEDLAEGYKDDNPLANSASYTVYLTDIDKQAKVVSCIQEIEGVRDVNYSESTAETLSDFGRLAGYISAGIIIILLAVGIFLISNTIMIGISVRKNEIAIMKLIGATDYFVRSPFVVEGVLIGLMGAAIPIVILYFVYEQLIGYVMVQFSTLQSYIDFLPTSDIFKILIPAGLLIGAGIGFIGSKISIRKHLRV